MKKKNGKKGVRYSNVIILPLRAYTMYSGTRCDKGEKNERWCHRFRAIRVNYNDGNSIIIIKYARVCYRRVADRAVGAVVDIIIISRAMVKSAVHAQHHTAFEYGTVESHERIGQTSKSCVTVISRASGET